MSFYPSHIAMSICYFEYCWNSAQGECHFLLCHSHTSDPSRLQMTKWIFRACIEEIKITRKSFLCPSTVILFFPLLCTQAYLSGPLSPTSLPGWPIGDKEKEMSLREEKEVGRSLPCCPQVSVPLRGSRVRWSQPQPAGSSSRFPVLTGSTMHMGQSGNYLFFQSFKNHQ